MATRTTRCSRLISSGLAALLLLTGSSAQAKILFRVSHGNIIELSTLIEDLRSVRIVIFGERHNSAEDHTAQRTLIQALHDAGVEVSIGLEMFRAEAQEKLDQWIGGDLSEEDFFGVYTDNWDRRWFSLYQDIFNYARQEKLPLVGLNVPTRIVRKVSREGFESLDEEERRAIDISTCEVSATYRNVLLQVIGADEKDSEKFDRFCQAQLVWDVGMAKHALRYVEANPERLLLILAGTFHAWEHGIPSRLKEESAHAYRVILPSSDDSFLNYDIALKDADYVWWIEQ